MKKVLIGLFLLITIVALGIFLYIRSLDWNALSKDALAELNQRFNGKIAVENVSIKGFSSISFQGVSLTGARGVLLRVKEVNAGLSLRELLSSRIKVSHFELVQPEFFLEQEGEVWNFSTLRLNEKESENKPGYSELKTENKPLETKGGNDSNAFADSFQFEVDSFQLSEGKLHVETYPEVSFSLAGSFHNWKADGVFHLNAPGVKGGVPFQYDLKSKSGSLKFDSFRLVAKELLKLFPQPVSLLKGGEVELKGAVKIKGENVEPQLKLVSQGAELAYEKYKWEMKPFEISASLESVVGEFRVEGSGLNLLMRVNAPIKNKIAQLERCRLDLSVDPSVFVSGVSGKLTLPVRFAGTSKAPQVQGWVKGEVHSEQLPGHQKIKLDIPWKLVENQKLVLDKLKLEGEKDLLLNGNGSLDIKSLEYQFKISGNSSRLGLYLPLRAGSADWAISGKGRNTESHLILSGALKGLQYEKNALDDWGFSADMQLNQQQSVDIKNLSLTQSGGGKLNFSGKVRQGAMRPLIDGNLSVSDLKLDTVMSIVLGKSLSMKLTSLKADFEDKYLIVKEFKTSGLGTVAARLKVDLDLLQVKESDVKISSVPLSKLVTMPTEVELKALTLKEDKLSCALHTGLGDLEATADASLQLGASPVKNIKFSGAVALNAVAEMLDNSAVPPLSGVLGISGTAPSLDFAAIHLNSRRVSMKLTSSASYMSIHELKAVVETNLKESSFVVRMLQGYAFNGLLSLSGQGSYSPDLRTTLHITLKDAVVNSFLMSIMPDMASQFEGKIDLNNTVVHILPPYERAWPLQANGDIVLKEWSYYYHETILDIMDMVEQNLGNKLVNSLIKKERNETHDPRRREPIRMKDVGPLHFDFNRGSLFIPACILEEQSGDVRFNAKNIEIRLPENENDPGFIQGTSGVFLSNAYVKRKWSVIKESYSDNIEFDVNLKGNFTMPISPEEKKRIQSELLKKLGSAVDWKKTGKKLEDEVKSGFKKLKEGGSEGLKNLLDKLF
jgi:hypothetical protein